MDKASPNQAAAALTAEDDNADVVMSSIPRDYNAAHDLLQRNLQAGRADQVAFVDDRVSIT